MLDDKYCHEVLRQTLEISAAQHRIEAVPGRFAWQILVERAPAARIVYLIRASLTFAPCQCLGMAGYGLSDSDFEELLESSSEDEQTTLQPGLQPSQQHPGFKVLTATAAREAVQIPCGEATRLVPPNRYKTLHPFITRL